MVVIYINKENKRYSASLIIISMKFYDFYGDLLKGPVKNPVSVVEPTGLGGQ